MDTRHFYRHKVTGVISSLNDSFAAAFGDRFERVAVPSRDAAPVEPVAETPTDTAPAATEVPVTPTADAPKEGDK